MAIFIQINGFNLYKPEIGYKDLVFSTRFFMENQGNVDYFDLNMKSAKMVTPALLATAAYILQVGTRVGDEFYLPHSCLDFLVENLKHTQHVCFREPTNPLCFSDWIYSSEIRVTPKDEDKVFVEVEKSFEIICGRFANFALDESTLYPLPQDFPVAFYKFIEGKNTLLEKKHVPVELMQGYVSGVLHNQVIEEEVVKEKNIIVKPEVKIYLRNGEQKGEIILKPVVSYGNYFDAAIGQAFEQGDSYKATRDGNTYIIKRDVRKEILLRNELNKYSQYLEYCGNGYACRNTDSVKMLVNTILPALKPDSEIIYEDGLEKLRVIKSKVTMHMNIVYNEANNLFDCNINFHCDNLKINLKDLVNHIQKNKSFIQSGLDYVELEISKEIRNFYSWMANSKDANISISDDRVKFCLSPSKAASFEEEFTECGNIEIVRDTFYKNLVHSMKTKKPIADVALDERLSKTLRHYQKEGVNWIAFLAYYGFGGILADDMGLGKTIQVLAMLKISEGKGTSIVICPKTLLYNWYEEIKKFTPGLKVLIPDGNAIQRKSQIEKLQEFDIVLTSYSLIQRDIEYYDGFYFNFCVLDEAQHIKNPDAKRAHGVKSLKAKNKLALTGTPIENSIMELWSLFDFLMPGFLGGRKTFSDKYSNSPALLYNRIKPFILRRTKKETLDELPPKMEQTQYAYLSEHQFAMYLSVLTAVRKNVFDTVESNGFEKSHIQILAALTKLRQICNHPGLVDEKYLRHKNVSAKLELFEELIDDCAGSGHKILVFSQFTKMLHILSEILKQKNILFSYLDGSTKERSREIKAFNENSDIQVFLISIKAGGLGLNLTSADTVILFDPWWNPMVENQAIDRAYRMGQKKSVNVYRLIAKETIEEKIQILQQKKQALFDSVMNENSEFISKLTWEDLKQVFM